MEFAQQMGILNTAIKAAGGEGHAWLTSPSTALYCIMLVGLWMTVGYNMIILLAGMQGISQSYYEAAALDGAGPIQTVSSASNTCFRSRSALECTATVLMPSSLQASIISGFQVFDTIYMMIGKTNPAYDDTQTLVMLFYRQAFDYGYKGYAAAISLFIFVIIMIVTVIQLIGQKKWVNYD